MRGPFSRLALASTRLGELEADLMKRLWRRAKPTTARELVDELQGERQIAYTTVMTVLANLFKKGWVRRELDGRAYRYEPVVSGEQYGSELLRQALDASPDRAAAFQHFLQQLSEEEVEALENAYRRRAGGSHKRDQEGKPGQ